MQSDSTGHGRGRSATRGGNVRAQAADLLALRSVDVGARTGREPSGSMGQAVRRRGEALENAILEAAWDLLAEGGLANLTFEAVAASAHTSRSVVYRRWRTREELVAAAISWQYANHPSEIPDTGTLRGDLLALMAIGVGADSDLLTIGTMFLHERGTSIDELRETVFAREPASMPTILLRAQRRGEVNLTGVPERVLNLPMELVRGQILTSGKTPTVQENEAILDEIYFPLLRAYGAVTG